ncbi:MAG: hypothetical protein IPI69_02340 [Bacteroidales bacterium]|nr:hypothetical protein [Bacteroidales bacterium]
MNSKCRTKKTEEGQGEGHRAQGSGRRGSDRSCKSCRSLTMSFTLNTKP